MTDEIKTNIKKNGAVRNPFYAKLNTEVVVPLGNEIYNYYSELAKINGEDIATLLRRCLTCYADELKTHESPMVIL